MEHKAFIIYKSHCKLISKLSVEQKGLLFQKIIDYHEEGIIYETDPKSDMAFEFMQINFDIDRERYERKCEALTENGKKGGRPKKETKENQTKPNAFYGNQTKPKKPKEEEKEDEEVNDNVKEKEIIIYSKEDTTALVVSEKKEEYGNEGINLMQKFLRQAVGVSAFKDSKERWYVTHCYNLAKKIGTEEFNFRLKEILSDPFKQKNSNKLAYLYGELKSFIHSPVVSIKEENRPFKHHII